MKNKITVQVTPKYGNEFVDEFGFDLLNTVSRDGLRNLAKEIGVATGRCKQDTIYNLLTASDKFNIGISSFDIVRR